MFRATHEITTRAGCYLVMLDANEQGAGPAHTREEWGKEVSADFEFDGERWKFQGDPSRIGKVADINDWFREPSGGIDLHARSAWYVREDEMHRRTQDDSERCADVRAPSRAELLARVVPPLIAPAVRYQVELEEAKPEALIEWWSPTDPPGSGR